MPIFNWPYTDLHSLNLDWIIKKIKGVETAEANSAASATDAAASKTAAAGSATAAAGSATAADGSAILAAVSAQQAQNLVDQLDTTIAQDVSDWLNTHITPTTPAVDDTLTVSGAAADAAVTGDKITELKTDLIDRTTFADTVFENGSAEYEPIYTNNAINNTTGEQSDEALNRASTPALYYIPVDCNVFVRSYNVAVYTCLVYFYSDDKQYIGRTTASDLHNETNVPVIEGTKYLRFFVSRKDNGDLTPADAASAVTFECVYAGRVKVMSDEITVLQNKTNVIVNDNLIDGFTENSGYYDGEPRASDSYVYFARVPVEGSKTYHIAPRSRMIYIYDSDGDLVQSVNQQNITEITTLGSGYAYITYYAEDDLDTALFYEDGAENVFARGYYALSDNVMQSDSLTGKKWAVLGDSFTAGADTGTIQDGTYAGNKIVYPYLIGNRTGINVLSFFAGGRTLAYPAVPDGFINSVTCPNQPYNYQNIPADTDYVTIYLGINDSHHAPDSGGGDGEDNTGIIPIGTITDATTETFYGAWNVVLTWLKTNRPFAHVGIIVSNGCETEDYRTATIAIAKKYGIPYIDLNGDERTAAMIRPQNADIASAVKTILLQTQAVDYAGGNYHPNNSAHEMESYVIENFLRSI